MVAAYRSSAVKRHSYPFCLCSEVLSMSQRCFADVTYERTVTIFRQLFDTRKTFRVLCAISKTCCSESTVKLSFAPRCHTICTAYSNLHLKVFKIIAVTLVNQPLLYSFIYFFKKLSNFLKQLVTVSLSKHHLN